MGRRGLKMLAKGEGCWMLRLELELELELGVGVRSGLESRSSSGA